MTCATSRSSRAGGAGPVHAAAIADLLHMPQVVIPPIAATYSAFGMFAMDVGRNYARSYIVRAAELDLERVRGLYAAMETEAVEGFGAIGVDVADITFARTVDVRYLGQFHEVEVPMASGVLDAAAIADALDGFHRRHRQLYTFDMPWQAVELLTFRLRATTPRAPFEMRRIAGWWSGRQRRHQAPATRSGSRATLVDTPIYDGALLRAGNEFHGPAIVEETTTSVRHPARAMRAGWTTSATTS